MQNVKNENLVTVLAALTAEKAPLTGENLGSLVEAIYADNGDKPLTNAQVNELTGKDGVLAGKLSAAQLRGKAVSAGYYAKKTEAEKASEHGTSQTRKSEFVTTLETLVSAPAGSFESFGKAKKSELEDFAKRLVAMSEQQAADKGERS